MSQVSVNEFGLINRETGKGVALTLQHLELGGVVHPAGAHLWVSHVFESGEAKPVEAVYCFALPRDAALRSFSVRVGDTRIDSKLLPRKEAEKVYEDGLDEGSLAVLAQGYRDGVVNLSVGNLRKGERVGVDLEIVAGVELRDDGYRFRFPFALSPTYHAKARYESDGSSGSMRLPSDEFGDVLLPSWLRDAKGLHTVGCSLRLVSGQGFSSVSSPSHRISVSEVDASTRLIGLAGGGDVPNRDLVLEVKAPSQMTSVYTHRRGDVMDFFAVVPSTRFGESSSTYGRVVFIVDRSGSMQGEPMSQAKAAVKACLGAFSGGEEFNVIAFDSSVEVFKPRPVDASNKTLEEARAFIDGIDARGGTELLDALRSGVDMLRGVGGDVFLVTDGQVSGTENIISWLSSANVRVHTLGIGSASQDRFISLISRASGGASRFLTPRERVDVGALEVFSSIRKPAATGVVVDMSRGDSVVEPAPAKTVLSGVPLTFFGYWRGGDAALKVSWSGGGFELPLKPEGDQDVVWLGRGARLITDEESTMVEAPGSEREAGRVDRRLRRLSEEYGLASRACSLVAVVKRVGDKPGEVPKTRIVPVGMPEDTAFGGYFNPVQKGMIYNKLVASPQLNHNRSVGAFYMMPKISLDVAESTMNLPSTPMDYAVSVASKIELDGGYPGKDEEIRSARSLAAYLVLKANDDQGVFKPHIEKLRKYLEATLKSLPKEMGDKIKEALKKIDEGKQADPKTMKKLFDAIDGDFEKLWVLLSRVF